MPLSVPAGVIVERVGDDLMVVVPGNTDVVSLSGRPAEVLLDVQAGRRVDSSDPALRDLVDMGIVSAPGVSRRGLMKAGAIGAGAGIAVFAMPSVAGASSSNDADDDDDDDDVVPDVFLTGIWSESGTSGGVWRRDELVFRFVEEGDNVFPGEDEDPVPESWRVVSSPSFTFTDFYVLDDDRGEDPPVLVFEGSVDSADPVWDVLETTTPTIVLRVTWDGLIVQATMTYGRS